MKRVSGSRLMILLFLILPGLALSSVELLQRHRFVVLAGEPDAAVAEIGFHARLTTTEDEHICLADGTHQVKGELRLRSVDTDTYPRSHHWILEPRDHGTNRLSGEPIQVWVCQRPLQRPTVHATWILDLHPSLRTLIESSLKAKGLRYTIFEQCKGK